MFEIFLNFECIYFIINKNSFFLCIYNVFCLSIKLIRFIGYWKNILFVGLLDRIFFVYLLMYNNDDDIIFFKLNLCVMSKISMVLLIYMDC